MEWIVVHFFDDNVVEAVPSSWVCDDTCYWPPYKGSKLTQAISMCDSPLLHEWEICKVQQLANGRKYSNLLKAKAKVAQAEYIFLNMKMKRRKKKKFLTCDEDYYEDDITQTNYDSSLENRISVVTKQKGTYQIMNEVSGGKQDVSNTSNWETLSEQSVSSLPAMHHHHQTLQQDTNSPVTQIIVPIPIRLQPPILTPIQTVADHWQQLDHIEESPFITRGIPLSFNVDCIEPMNNNENETNARYNHTISNILGLDKLDDISKSSSDKSTQYEILSNKTLPSSSCKDKSKAESMTMQICIEEKTYELSTIQTDRLDKLDNISKSSRDKSTQYEILSNKTLPSSSYKDKSMAESTTMQICIEEETHELSTIQTPNESSSQLLKSSDKLCDKSMAESPTLQMIIEKETHELPTTQTPNESMAELPTLQIVVEEETHELPTTQTPNESMAESQTLQIVIEEETHELSTTQTLNKLDNISKSPSDKF